jgi:hypothetical protein
MTYYCLDHFHVTIVDLMYKSGTWLTLYLEELKVVL